uniref:C3H1-type domain-containing protein n=2 Tax=Alexandrium monilatum TaxID=311494 RepID=A0A7S4SLR3_9DINO
MNYLAKIAAEAMKRAAKDAHVHHHRERRGWSVVVRVSADELAHLAEPLLVARREVLRHTRALAGTVPLRFREKTQGFCISIGFVDDRKYQVCWDAAETGHCCRGQTCRWEHPRNIQHLFVAVKLACSGACLQGGEGGQESEQAEVTG